MPLRHLRAVFERSGAFPAHFLPLRKTHCGTWVPTPLRAIEEGCKVLEDIGLLGRKAPPGDLIDAGTGDGRLPAFLAQRDSHREIHGIELDPVLFALAQENLETLETKGVVGRTHVHLLEGDYGDVSTYRAGGIDLHTIHMFFNYPDGNQARLARFIRTQVGPETKLCILTHDRTLEIDDLIMQDRHDLHVGDEQPWRLSIYGMDSAREI